MRPEDLGRVVAVSDPAVAPDGFSVVVVVSRVDMASNQACSALWLVPVNGSAPRSLTSGDHSDSNPRWSPAGGRLAFTRTSREGNEASTSVIVLRSDAPGESLTVTTGGETVTSLAWSPDGRRLAWCARVPEVEPGTLDRDRPPRRITTLHSRVDDLGWIIDRRSHVHIAVADEAGEPRAVTSGPYDHGAVAWSPDGASLVVAAGRHEGWDLDEVVDLWLVDPDPAGDRPSKPRRITDGTQTWNHPSWSPDGSRIAALAVDPSTGWRNTRPMTVEVSSGAALDLAPGFDRNFAPYPGARPPVWETGGATALATVEDRGRVSLWRLDGRGAAPPKRVLGGDRVVAGFDAAAGVIATIVTDTTAPAELEVGELRTSFASEFVIDVPPLPVHRFTVPSPAEDGDIDTWLICPTGFDPDAGADPSSGVHDGGEPWPLLLAVHGGPMTQYGDRWFDEFQLLAAAGYVVVAANPHGSSGREEAWARSIRSPKAAVDPGTGWGGIDADDLVAVVDATLRRWPALDPARVGVLGGSYGGFMTTWLLARTDRFAAGVSERAVNNLLSEEWSADLGGSFHRTLGVTHLDDAGEYLRMSPATYAADITVPILILHSEQDLRCPTEQADALFVALRLLGHHDVEYWRFPGEGHEMSRSGSPWHRVRRAEIIQAFFDRTIGSGGSRPR